MRKETALPVVSNCARNVWLAVCDGEGISDTVATAVDEDCVVGRCLLLATCGL